MDLHHVLPQVRITDFSLSQESLSSISVSAANMPNRLSVSDSETSCSPKGVLSPSPSPYNEQWWSGKFDFAAKIIILGDYGVGKTTLLSTLGGLKDMGWCRCVSFRPNEFVEMECVKNEKKVLIRIMDTGGQERYRSMTSSYFRGVHGCLLMFDVTNEESFDHIINWFNDLGVYTSNDNICTLVVGTSAPSSKGRRVTAERAFQLAESLNLTYCETDVRDEEMVLWILTRLVSNVIVSRVRRQSLAISIMPPLRAELEKKAKRRWKCCMF